MTNTVTIGQTVEALAAGYLKRQGLEIIKRNYRCKGGEIDLIARDGGTLVFVEVRHRKTEQFGTPAETVTAGKQARLRRAAQHYLLRQKSDPACRFDIIESRPGNNGQPVFNWIMNAF